MEFWCGRKLVVRQSLPCTLVAQGNHRQPLASAVVSLALGPGEPPTWKSDSGSHAQRRHLTVPEYDLSLGKTAGAAGRLWAQQKQGV